jgi:hypothetical protein
MFSLGEPCGFSFFPLSLGWLAKELSPPTALPLFDFIKFTRGSRQSVLYKMSGVIYYNI